LRLKPVLRALDEATHPRSCKVEFDREFRPLLYEVVALLLNILDPKALHQWQPKPKK
jgi:hypothetical protein